MSSRPRGRPRKKTRKNQVDLSTGSAESAPTPNNSMSLDAEVPVPHKNTSWKGWGGSVSDFESDLDPGDDSDDECEGNEFIDLDDEDFGIKLAEMALWDDPTDTDWIPPRLRQKPRASKVRPSTYVKGPDVMNKSYRTYQRYIIKKEY